ncbi:MAG TPA: hypothetical protein PK595_04290 [Bacteroidota bacterium]|nr:hypothetical protein [Bacteroidota bacterium]
MLQGKYTTFLQSHQVQRKCFLTLVLLLLLFQNGIGMGERLGRGTKSIALSNAFVAVADDPWTIFYNPAGLIQLSSIEAGAFIIPNQFGISELRTVSSAMALPLKYFSAGIAAEQFGFQLYREVEGRCAIAASIINSIGFGVSCNYHKLIIERYGSASVFSFDIGILASMTKNASLGFSAKNITGATVSHLNEKLPQIFSVGVAQRFSHGFLITVEAEKDIRYPYLIKAGIEHRIFNVLYLRCGINSQPKSYSLGGAVSFYWCSFGYACHSHPFLGYTHQVDIKVKL